MTEATGGLIHGVVLDGRGGGREVDWAGVRSWTGDAGPLWMHLERTREEAVAWLTGESGLDAMACEALLSSSTRPRFLHDGEALLLTLRGVNLNPGADPEDMISIRIWADESRVISLRRERIMATEDVHAAFARSRGPCSTGELVVRIIQALNERMAPTLDDIGESLDDLEDAVVDPARVVARSDLAPLRHQIIALRRFLAPQRQAMVALCAEPAGIFGDHDRNALRESSNRLLRYVEDLDAARERAVVIQDELATQMAEQLNARIYVLTVIAAIVLPLSLLAGMLGMNVTGIPAADHSWSFAAVCGSFVVFGVVLVAVLRRMKWL